MIVNVHLRDNDQRRLTESVERKIGESQENIEDEWEAVQTFLFELKPVEVNWAKMTSCMQKTGESVAEFEERFRQTWTEHAGVNNNSEDLSKDTSMPLKTAFVNGLKPEISHALKIKYDDWDSTGTTFIQIVEWSAKIERTQAVKLRALQSKTFVQQEDNRLMDSMCMQTRKVSTPYRREKAYTETSTIEAEDDVLEDSAANQVIKERARPMSNENPTSDSLVQSDERLSLAIHNAKNQVLIPPKGAHGVPAFQRMSRDIQCLDCTALAT
ncbi:Altered inheritance of mitochondria protein 44 [Labeo rohita]|uniref:Altered inheritance of mitochondria protein 44 n=1 Tax=Labeo rohita TaxID=84645 RepID=A0ABQ8LAG0_LABRO|nr:Altered inheritance of mitochondria protein 44 [Labeo rohita]